MPIPTSSANIQKECTPTITLVNTQNVSVTKILDIPFQFNVLNPNMALEFNFWF